MKGTSLGRQSSNHKLAQSGPASAKLQATGRDDRICASARLDMVVVKSDSKAGVAKGNGPQTLCDCQKQKLGNRTGVFAPRLGPMDLGEHTSASEGQYW